MRNAEKFKKIIAYDMVIILETKMQMRIKSLLYKLLKNKTYFYQVL